ncbi:MAG: ribonuclease III [Acidimicrobiia bacterium]|nr:ribonuclease III [Acidimicrobiia bacterium]
MNTVVVFRTASEIEARVVLALLDSHGITGLRSGGHPSSIWPVAINTIGEFRISVHEAEADEALRIIEGHRAQSSSHVVRLADEFEALEAALGYRFHDRGLLEHALTHTSRVAEDASGGVADNESMEFLGDAVIGFVVADVLFHQFPDRSEGQKSKLKAAVVSTQALARQAERLRLGDHLLLGRGEEKTGGRFKQALLADTFEAVVAAVYLDGGVEAAAKLIRRQFQPSIEEACRADVVGRDFKSALQEHLQAAGQPPPEYRITGEEGPAHRRVFHVEVVTIRGRLARATGRTKKEAEQEAARQALDHLREPPAEGPEP